MPRKPALQGEGCLATTERIGTMDKMTMEESLAYNRFYYELLAALYDAGGSMSASQIQDEFFDRYSKDGARGMRMGQWNRSEKLRAKYYMRRLSEFGLVTLDHREVRDGYNRNKEQKHLFATLTDAGRRHVPAILRRKRKLPA
jgi:hypothetical protein